MLVLIIIWFYVFVGLPLWREQKHTETMEQGSNVKCMMIALLVLWLAFCVLMGVISRRAEVGL